MDGHRGGDHQGTASQNPAYRPAHRHHQVRALYRKPVTRGRHATGRAAPGWRPATGPRRTGTVRVGVERLAGVLVAECRLHGLDRAPRGDERRGVRVPADHGTSPWPAVPHPRGRGAPVRPTCRGATGQAARRLRLAVGRRSTAARAADVPPRSQLPCRARVTEGARAQNCLLGGSLEHAVDHAERIQAHRHAGCAVGRRSRCRGSSRPRSRVGVVADNVATVVDRRRKR
jgi:hypothetical protein